MARWRGAGGWTRERKKHTLIVSKCLQKDELQQLLRWPPGVNARLASKRDAKAPRQLGIGGADVCYCNARGCKLWKGEGKLAISKTCTRASLRKVTQDKRVANALPVCAARCPDRGARRHAAPPTAAFSCTAVGEREKRRKKYKEKGETKASGQRLVKDTKRRPRHEKKDNAPSSWLCATRWQDSRQWPAAACHVVPCDPTAEASMV